MKQFIDDIKQILEQARQKAYSATATAMIEGYWLMGKRIVEEEQDGNHRAAYGKEMFTRLSEELGKGFSARTLRDYRQFYLTFPKWEDLAHACAKLNWSHIRLIMRVSDKKARDYYLKETSGQNWAVRTLERNINTLYYQRLLSSQIEQPVIDEMKEKSKEFKQDHYEFIRNPAVLEFLNIPTNYTYTEQHLETDRTIAKYSVLNENKQLFANKYLPYLPTEEELEAEIEREKQIIKQQLDGKE